MRRRSSTSLALSAWSDGSFLERSAAIRRIMDRERSRLCMGVVIPPYVAYTLDARARRELIRSAGSREHDWNGVGRLRVFFDNGVEIRAELGAMLEVRTLYHVHPWLIRQRPAHRIAAVLRRPPFESRTDLIGLDIYDPAQITDPELSAHRRIAIASERRRALDAAPPAGARDTVIDASGQTLAWIRCGLFTLVATRSSQGGVSLNPIAVSRDRFFGATATRGRPERTARRTREAAELTDQLLRSQTGWRSAALELAIAFGPLLWLTEIGLSHLGRLFRNIANRLIARIVPERTTS